MAILIVHRDTALSDAERSTLPAGVTVAQAMGDVVARVELNMATDSLLQFAFKLGQAVSGGTLEVRGIPAAASASSGVAPSGASPMASTDAPVGDSDPWRLAGAGSFAAAEGRLAGLTLDSNGRDRIRELFDSTDPERAAFACRAAGLTGWKSFAPNLRRALTHGDVRVRREAATALGVLAGPSLLPALEKLRDDVSPEVREAAELAIATIEAR